MHEQALHVFPRDLHFCAVRLNVNRSGGFLSPSGDWSAAFQPVITLAHLTTPLCSPPAIRRILNRRLRSRALSLSGIVGGH